MSAEFGARTRGITILAMIFGLALATPTWAQDPVPSAESLEGAFPAQKHFSPYAGRNFPTDVYWGDLHNHTRYSFDSRNRNLTGVTVVEEVALARETASPAFLCHDTNVASATDSGKGGTFISILISFSVLSCVVSPISRP